MGRHHLAGHHGFHQAEAPTGTALGAGRQEGKILELHKNQLTESGLRGLQAKQGHRLVAARAQGF